VCRAKNASAARGRHHKIICGNPTDAGPFETFFDNIQFHPIKVLRHWCRRLHGPIVDWACANAYELKHHPERCPTHVFLLKLQRTNEPAVGSGKKIGKMFKVMDASLVSREALLSGGATTSRGNPKYDETNRPRTCEPGARDKAHNSYGRVVRHILLSYGLYMGSRERSEDENWKAVLQSFTDGKGEYEMVQGNPVRKR